MSFLRALPVTLRLEGHISDHPADRGGRTKWGITQGAYDRWRTDQGVAPQAVDHLTPDERDAIYRDDYWFPARCNVLPDPVAGLHFDAAVHHGVGGAARILQRAVGATADGIIGPRTIGAVVARDRRRVGEAMLLERTLELWRQVLDTPGQGAFARGWRNRVIALRREYLGGA